MAYSYFDKDSDQWYELTEEDAKTILEYNAANPLNRYSPDLTKYAKCAQLKAYRESLDLSAREFAKAHNMKASTYTDIENGVVEMPEFLSKFLDVFLQSKANQELLSPAVHVKFDAPGTATGLFDRSNLRPKGMA